jgi:hypothetical protein
MLMSPVFLHLFLLNVAWFFIDCIMKGFVYCLYLSFCEGFLRMRWMDWMLLL